MTNEFSTKPFVQLNDREKLEQLFSLSNEKPIIIFKHSVTCPISHDVFQDTSASDNEVFLVIVQNSRQISNEIAEKTGIRHESPQAIILRNGKAVWHASHYDITKDELDSAFQSAV